MNGDGRRLRTFALDQVALKAGRRVRHVLEARHRSFMTTEFVAIARRYDAAIALTDSDEYPCFGDVTADFVYLRLVRSQVSLATGYDNV